MMLIAGLFGRANHRELSAPFWRRLESMLEFIASVMDVAGNVPHIGDSDDGVMLRLSPRGSTQVFASLLATGAVIFERGDLKSKAGVFDDKSRWLLGDAAAARFSALQSRTAHGPLRARFPQGGYYVLGEGFETSREVRVIADAGPLGYLAIAAHGHADALSVLMSVAGRPLLIDSGTYAYHVDKSWRDYFRGTSAHNTLRVDRRDQSESGGNFLWLRHAHAHVEQFDAQAQRLIAWHDGYRRLADPVTHRRLIGYDASSSTLTVEDQVSCAASHFVEIFWHVAPEWSVASSALGVELTQAELAVHIELPQRLRLRLARGEEDPPLGWASTRLDEKRPCTTLALSGGVTAPGAGFTTRIRVKALG
jgi:hypothetical protein